MLRIRLLGELELRLGNAALPPLDSGRAESLLAYLLLHRTAPQPRRRLAFLLWPESTEPQARTNLRHVLHTLRHALPDAERYLEVTPRTLRWRPDAPCELDLAAFDEALARAEREDGDGAVAALEDAVRLYRGDLLEGSYDEWVFDERELVRQRYLAALERLVALLEERGQAGEAVPYAERLLRHDPLREETCRTLMRLHAARGDRARALRVYHRCSATLERDLGVEPSAATRELYEALVAGGEEGGDESLAPRGGLPLVGRTSERTRLVELWRRSEQGHAQLVLVTGEPGIGKSRLVEELRSWCAHRGAATAEARAYPAEGPVAYAGAVAWLRSEDVAPRLQRLAPRFATELARLLPELAERRDVPSPEPLPESEQRQRLFGALAAVLAATGTPLLLVADDLQWFDVQTLQFLHHLVRSRPEARLLVAASLRREDLDAGHAASAVLSGLEGLGRVTELALHRLGPDETRTLAERIAGTKLTDADAGRLYADSEGIPLFVVEALRAGRGTPPGGGSPHAVIAARLAQLSRPAAELAGVAATIGREFTAQLLADASGAAEHEFVRSLDELWRRGLVRAHDPGTYDFAHGKIREAAYEALSPPQREHHHLRVARALQRGGERDVAARVAAHCDAAGAAEEAVVWYERAAEAAQRLHASAAAAHALRRAIELVRSLPDRNERAALELRLLTALPAPLVSLEGYLSESVTEVHERALELAAELGVEPEPPLARSLALATLSRGDFEGARPFAEQLRARAERDRDGVLWVESAYVLGIAAYWQGRLEEARAHFQAAVDRYRPEQRAEHLLRYGQDPRAFCQMRLAHTLWLLGRGAEGEQARDEALALAERLGHPYTRAASMIFAAILALDQGDDERFRRYTAEMRPAEGLDEAGPAPVGAEAFAGYLDVVDGAVEAGLRHVRQSYEDARRRAAAPGHPGFAARLLVGAHARAGNAAAGLAAADEALQVGGGAQLWEAELRRLRAGFLAALGAPRDDVAAELEHAVAVAQRQGARAFELRAREDLAGLRAETP